MLQLRLHLPAARSLKDRRRVVRRAVDRVTARFSVSIAEVGDIDHWQSLTLGAAVVSRSAGHAREVIDKVSATVVSSVAAEAVLVRRDVMVTRADTESSRSEFDLSWREKVTDDDDAKE